MVQHRLSNIDSEARTATCKRCGPVEIRWRSTRGLWRCMEAMRAEKRKYRSSEYKYEGGTVVLNHSEVKALKAGAECAICHSTEALRIDHCHTTGKIRGVLCHHCNIMIGMAREDKETLRKAIEYLS